MTKKYADLRDVGLRIDKALNHHGVRKVFNVETYVEGWLRTDKEKSVHPDRSWRGEVSHERQDYAKAWGITKE